MIISVKCNISLSKKLRALSKRNTKFYMNTKTLINGVGEGTITFEADDNSDLSDLLNKETSIIIVPTETVDQTQAPQQQEQSDNTDDSRVANLFMNGANIEENDSPIIQKMAAVKPPNNKAERAYSVKPKVQIENEVPSVFKESQKPEAKRYITELSQLLEAVKCAENKKSNIDISKIENPRLRAVAMEEKEKAEAIDYPAFIVNTSCATLSINDLGINLALNIPYNLNNISAKKIANSKDLGAMIRAKMIKFVRPDEVQSYRKQVINEQDKYGLEVYDNRRQAEAAIGEMGESKAHMSRVSQESELSLNDLEGPTEEEKILMSLPPRKESRGEHQNNGDDTVITSHGLNPRSNRLDVRSREVPSTSVENSKGIKSIRKSGVSYNWQRISQSFYRNKVEKILLR